MNNKDKQEVVHFPENHLFEIIPKVPVTKEKRISRFSDRVDIPSNLQTGQSLTAVEQPQNIAFKQDTYTFYENKNELQNTIQTNYANRRFSNNELDARLYAEDCLIDLIRHKVNHRPYRVNQQIYSDICDRMQEHERRKNVALSDNGESHLNEIKDIGLILDEEDLGETDDYNVVFIRHAFSGINYFNERFQDILCSRQHKQHFRLRLFDGSTSFIDSELHTYGLMQCEMKEKKIQKIRFNVVFVSPMQRALQSCVEMFKNHPDKHSILFYVHADLGEMLKKDSDIFDYQRFVCSIDDAQSLGITFNIVKYFSPTWQADLICKQFDVKQIQLNPLSIKNILFQIFPQPVEYFSTFKRRCLNALRDVQILQRSNNSLIAIISHSLVQKAIFESIGINDTPSNNLQSYHCKL